MLSITTFIYATFTLGLIVLLIKLIYPIVFPTIITYPWDDGDGKKTTSKAKKERQQTKQGKKEGETIVIFAASYNPPHNGHLALLQYLATKYDKVIAVIGYNPDKTYPVSPQDRAQLLQDMIQSSQQTNQNNDNKKFNNIEVQVVEGYIWRYAKRIGATIFFRGIRSWDKDGEDERSLQILNTWGPILLGPCYIPIPTIYIEGQPKYNHISSTLIRNICINNKNKNNKGGDQKEEAIKALSELVPPSVAQKVMTLYGTTKES